MAGRKPAKKKAARRRAPKKVAKKKVVRPLVVRKSLPTRPSAALIAITPEVFLEMLRSRGLILNPFSKSKSVLVKFDDKGKLNHPSAKRSLAHEVSFQNKGERDRKLKLSYWPFVGPEAPILVPSGATVGPFALNPNDDYVGPVTASGTPPFGGGGGPGDPGFDVDG